jgi:hypothetical protein
MAARPARRSLIPRLRLPQAIWFFFASEPSNMALAKGVEGFGFKAATLDASSPATKLLLPFAPLGVLACRVPALYRVLWPAAQRVLKISEKPISAAMEEWHDYEVAWSVQGARWVVDGVEMWRSSFSPCGSLGFVAWMDNQYMITTPQGCIRNGTVATGEQWLEIASLSVGAANSRGRGSGTTSRPGEDRAFHKG